MNALPAMLTRRESLRQLAQIALPMVISQSCDTLMVFTDRLFLARLNPELMNAVMGGGLTEYTMISFFLGLMGYTNALVAQNFGAGRKSHCSRVTTQALLVALVAYPLLLMGAPLAHAWFEAVHLPPHQIGPQKEYFDLLLYGAFFSLTRATLSGFFSGIGRTRLVMVASLASLVTNTVLNYAFVFGRWGFSPMGIRGAAYGTLIAGFLGCLILVWAYLRRSNRQEFSIDHAWRLDWPTMRTFLQFGAPTGVEILLVLLGFNAMVLVYHGHGAITATAATIALNWDLVSFVPLIGVEIGVTSLVGRYMGARRPDLAHQAVMSGIQLGLVYSGIIFVLFAGIPQVLVSVFQPSVPDIVFTLAAPTAVWMIRWAAVYVLVETLFIVFIGALRGAGDTLWAMFLSVGLHWVLTLAVYLTLNVFDGTPKQAWLSMVILFTLSSYFVYARYRRGHWKTLTVVEPINESR